MKDVYSCFIVDDEPAAHMVLKSYIAKESNLQLVAQCFNVLELTAYLKHNTAALLFLDIHMPEINGIEFLELHPNPPKTILTTAYSEYALESYNYDVVDYLLKPISYPRFQQAVNRFLLLHSPTELFEPKLINIKVDKQIIQLSESDIDYIQSFGNYVKVFVGSKYYLASTTTQEILSDLSSKLFVRIHKSFAINWTKVSDYTEKEVFILDKKLPIGITFKRKFMDRMEKVG